MSKPHIHLFIPGPIEVHPDVYQAMSVPMIDHRSQEFVELYKKLQPQLRKLFFTQNPVYLMTCSSFGAMEASIRNITSKKALFLVNGAWSEKWYDTAAACGKVAEKLTWDWGQPIDPAAVERKLSEGGFDAVFFVSSETSTGVFSNIKELMAVIRKFPEVISAVDTVSSFTTQPIHQDELGIDIMLSGTQKALALPPGLAVCSVSRRALERAKAVPHHGTYLDLVNYHKFHEQNQTPNTPAISIIQGLSYRCDQIEKEGLQNRYQRHQAMHEHVLGWCEANGFPLFPPKGYDSVSVVCARNDRKIDLEKLNDKLRREHHMMINTGYGKLKGLTFRISTMGDETVESLRGLTAAMDKVLGTM